MSVRIFALTASLVLTTAGCVAGSADLYVPSTRYSADPAQEIDGVLAKQYKPVSSEGRAKLRMADGGPTAESDYRRGIGPIEPQLGENRGDVGVVRSNESIVEPYKDPLPLGDPGISSSLYREARAWNDMFRDIRAWQPMDLLTIVVSERSLGLHDANTEITQQSSVLASLQKLLGVEEDVADYLNLATGGLNPAIEATTQNDFIGEGQTRRESQLTARIAAVVVEVLPSGVLRIEGEKIIAVNNEEQVMVISGLVRTRDIDSNNDIDSSKVAQMRIDYFGKGIVGEAQYGGWFARLLRYVWPF